MDPFDSRPKALFGRTLPTFQSAKLRFYHEFFLRDSGPGLESRRVISSSA